MIKANARLIIRRLPLSYIQICEYQQRYPGQLALYMRLLNEHPDDYAGLLFVVPSNTHPGMYILLDGHHKFCASVMTGRCDALCIVIEEESEEDYGRQTQDINTSRQAAQGKQNRHQDHRARKDHGPRQGKARKIVGKRKKLRKRCEHLAYQVQVLELEQRLDELKQQRPFIGFEKERSTYAARKE